MTQPPVHHGEQSLRQTQAHDGPAQQAEEEQGPAAAERPHHYAPGAERVARDGRGHPAAPVLARAPYLQGHLDNSQPLAHQVDNRLLHVREMAGEL